MPDRYGETTDPNPNHPDTKPPNNTRHTTTHAITNCPLCDDDGYRGSTVCDHTDHRAAARRGMDLVRESMGWNTPNKTSQTSRDETPHPTNHTNQPTKTRPQATQTATNGIPQHHHPTKPTHN